MKVYTSGNLTLTSAVASTLPTRPIATDDRIIIGVVEDPDHESSVTVCFDDGLYWRESFLDVLLAYEA
jgi:hypothetical protein